MKAFVTNWLNREQNKGGSYSRSTTIAKQGEQKRKTFSELADEIAAEEGAGDWL
jgi:hypothetical protein